MNNEIKALLEKRIKERISSMNTMSVITDIDDITLSLLTLTYYLLPEE